MKYIYHHLGLGDHIICNGLVRFLQKKYETVSVFVKKHNHNNVSYMFRDNKNIILIPLKDDIEVNQFIKNNNVTFELIKVGHEKMSFIPHNVFDEGFYLSINLPFYLRFSEFYFERDFEKEKKIYQSLNPDNKKYIFTHGVNKNKHRSDLMVIDNPIQFNIFDLLYTIENAEEVHLMESSLKCLVNSYKMKKPKMFYHQYVRNYPQYNNTQGINEFNIIF